MSCVRRGDPPLIGGTLWTDLDALTRARYLEVFLTPGDGRYHVAAWQSRIIEALTDKPTMGSPTSPPADKPGIGSQTPVPADKSGHPGRFQNCRVHGMNDTEERIRKGRLRVLNPCLDRRSGLTR